MLARFNDPNAVPSKLDLPSETRFSIVTTSAGWPEDLQRLATSFATHCEGYEHLAIANANKEVEEVIERIGAGGICFAQRVGFGAAMNAGIRQCRGDVVVVCDTSVEATGNFLDPLASALDDGAIGLAGPWGLVTEDMRSFEEATEGPVHAMQGYCIAFRRKDLSPALMFDPKFKFYRNADIDFSLRWKDAGYAIKALPVPLTRHSHREWDSMPEDEREKKSRDNFARLLRSWGNRMDLIR